MGGSFSENEKHTDRERERKKVYSSIYREKWSSLVLIASSRDGHTPEWGVNCEAHCDVGGGIRAMTIGTSEGGGCWIGAGGEDDGNITDEE